MTASLSYLTPDIPGTGGRIKQRPGDFAVEELPLYDPCGEGEHLYLFIEKTGRTTSDTIRRLARLFRVRRSDIGYAGLKDKHAVTRQHLSVYLPDPSEDAKFLERIGYTPIKLLWSARHTNKLRRGHLAGNRFTICIREVDPAAVVRARRVIDRLEAQGVPNFLGEQRFGYRQNNHVLGRLLLLEEYEAFLDELVGNPREDDFGPTHAGRIAYERGDYVGALQHWPRKLRHDRQALDALRQRRTPQQAVAAIDAPQREFVVNSFQSALFNRVLDRRLRDGLLRMLLVGDLAWKHDSRAVFAVDEQAAEAENAPGGRVERFELSPSGPMWGHKMTRAAGRPGEWERAVLDEEGIDPDLLASSPYAVEGRRRPMRVKLENVGVAGGADEHGPFIRLSFDLPRGSFATIVTREVIKPEQTGGDAGEDEESGDE